MTATSLAYYWGDDVFGLERAASTLGARVAADVGGPLDSWRTSGAEATPNQIGERIATGTLFGGGTLVLVTDPHPLIRSADGRAALAAILPSLAPGNALVFIDPMDRFARQLDTARAAFAESIRAAGGEVKPFAAPNSGAMPVWIADRARELGLKLGPGASVELGRRIGALVRESDIDRRYQGQLAVSELEKLALLHPDGSEATVADVVALVPEAVPGSTWGFLDALGERRTKHAAEFLGRLLETTPQPLLLAQMYGRIRQLLEVTDRLESGEAASTLPRSMGLKPYPADKMAGMAHHWSVPELVAALDGLFELDALVKGSDGTSMSDQSRKLAFTLWLAEHVARS